MHVLTTVSQNPDHWRKILAELQEQKSSLTAQRWEAMIEGWFRLALTKGTSFADSVNLLSNCLRRDGSNPKFAYHLGRIFFAQGRLEEAGHWLRVACQLNPTSHRVWSHACLLHWELNEQLRDPKKYEPDSLRNRGKAIAEVIKRGEEPREPVWMDFTPEENNAEKERRERAGARGKPPAKAAEGVDPEPVAEEEKSNGHWRTVPRYLNPGVLRWSGIKDIQVEQELQGEARQGMVKTLVPLLTEVAGDARRRRGGLAAFAVLGVQWLLSGYPAASLRRFAGGLELTDEELAKPSLQLLNRVLDIHEAEDQAGLEQLTRAASIGDLPPLLTALIHRRRFLTQSLKFSELSVYRLARRVLSEAKTAGEENRSAQEQRAIEVAGRLEKLVDKLAAEPPRVLEDWIPNEGIASCSDGKSAESPDLMLERLETHAAALNGIKQGMLELLNQEILAAAKSEDDQTRLQAAADLEAVSEIVQIFQQAEEVGTKQLADLRETLNTADASQAPENFPERGEALKALLAGLSSLGPAQRKLKKAKEGLSAKLSKADVAAASPREALAEAKGHSGEALKNLAPPAVGIPDQDSGDRKGQLDRLEQAALQLDQVKTDLLEFLRGAIVPAAGEAETQGQAKADLDVLNSLLDRISHAGQDAAGQLEELIDWLEDAGSAEAPENFSERSEALKARLNGLSSLGPAKRNMKKCESKLTAAAAQNSLPQVPPSEALAGFQTVLYEALAEIGPASPADAAEELPPEPKVASQTAAPETRRETLRPIERLAQAIQSADLAVDAMFDRADQSFAGYSPWVRGTPPIRDLSQAIKHRRAEVLFRMGRRGEAKRAWSRLLREDAHDMASCVNVAVCDTWSANAAGALASWNLYADRLYARATASGDVRDMAEQRIALHRSFGQGYAVRSLSQDLDQSKDESPDETLAFIANGRRVKSFIDHKLLEFLNQQVGYRSPSLVLGVARDDSEETRNQAALALAEFAQKACGPLPPHSRDEFAKLVSQRLDAAQSAFAESQKDRRGGTPPGDVHFAEEHDGHLRLLSDMAGLKLKLYQMALSNRDFVKRMPAVDFLDQFRRLDDLPLTLSEQFGKPVALPLGMQPDILQSLMKLLAENLCAHLMAFLFEPAENAEDRQRQQDQYERLTEQWVHSHAFKDFLPLIDNPGNFYPKKIKEYIGQLGEEGIPKKLVEALREFNTRYPRMAGVARDFAQLLLKDDKTEEALSVLAKASKDGCHEDGRKLCRHFGLQVRAQISAAKEDFPDAIKCTEELVREDHQAPVFVQNLIYFYQAQAQKTGEDPGFEKLRETVSQWIARAREFLNSWQPDDPAEKCPIHEKHLSQVIHQLETGILKAHIGCAISHYNRGVKFAQEKSLASAKSAFETAREFANHVVEHADKSAEHQELIKSADDLLKSIADIFSQI